MTASSKSTPAAPERSAIAVLKDDHRNIARLFEKFECAGTGGHKAALARQICNELLVHTMIEEEIFYPACRQAGVEHSATDEAQVAHDTAKVLIAGLLRQQPDSPFYDARMKVLAEYITHHFNKEEYPGSGLFARAKAAIPDMEALGKRLQARRDQLMELVRREDLSPSAPRSLEFDPTSRDQRKEPIMARPYDPDPDDQDQFMSEDELTRRLSHRTRRGLRDKRLSREGSNGHDGGWYGEPRGQAQPQHRSRDNH